MQTFNTSLPHAFVGSAQATTIVDHRVEISDKLVLKVFIEATTIVDHKVEISDKLVLKVFIEATTIVDHRVDI